MKYLSSVRKEKLKGFTLIELLVVIAIIAVLAGILSTVIAGFVRDSRIESNNTTAKLMYTAVQSALIDREIDNTHGFLDAYVAAGVPFDAKANFKYVVLEFDIEDGQMTGNFACSVNCLLPSGSKNTNIAYGLPAASVRAEYKKLFAEQVLKKMSTTANGSYRVYIDAEDYVVDSVLYSDDEKNKATPSHGGFDKVKEYYWDDETAVAGYYKYFKTCKNLFDHRDVCKKSDGDYFGCYPYIDDVKTATQR